MIIETSVSDPDYIFCSLDVLYGGLVINCSLIQKRFNLCFFNFWIMRTLDPDSIWIRIGIKPKMLDPDP
jgi:hypothetical protein